MSSFSITNVGLSQAAANTQEQISKLSYTPVWKYSDINDVAIAGNFSITPDFAYKVVNVIDANGINIKYWLNNFDVLINLSNTTSPPFGGFGVYVSAVDGESGNISSVSDVSNVVDNGNKTYTLQGGDVITSGSFIKGQKIYMSYFTR